MWWDAISKELFFNKTDKYSKKKKDFEKWYTGMQRKQRERERERESTTFE